MVSKYDNFKLMLREALEGVEAKQKQCKYMALYNPMIGIKAVQRCHKKLMKLHLQIQKELSK